jgi:hypothetical protein
MMPITRTSETPASATAPQPVLCPVCSGPVQEARGQLRCNRCRFQFCQECEGFRDEIARLDWLRG